MKGLVSNVNELSIEIKVEEKIFSLPRKIYENYNIKPGDLIEGNIVYDDRKNKEIFEPNHPKYKIGDIVDFPVIDFDRIYNKNIITVSDCFENRISVLGSLWFTKESFKVSTIKCEVVGFQMGKPNLKNKYFYHPLYKIDNEYDFKFIGIETKELHSGNKLDVIKLRGEDGFIHETTVQEGQSGHKFKPVKIRCKVVEITNFIRLEQLNIIDFYFSKIEEILPKQKELTNKYFYSLKDRTTDSEVLELFKQYESGSSLWTITYCGRILPEIIKDLLENYNIKESISVIGILISVERWILTSGFLDSFRKESTISKTKIKSEQIIHRFSIIKRALEMVQNGKLDADFTEDLNQNVLLLVYFIRYNRIELIDISIIVDSIVKLIISYPKEMFDYSCVKSLVGCIEYLKTQLKKDDLETDFTVIEYNINPFNNDSELKIYIKFVISQIILLNIISEKERRNQNISQLFKYLSIYFKLESEKRECLKFSFFFCTNLDYDLMIEESLINKLDDFKLVFNTLTESIDLPYLPARDEEWKNIIESKNSESVMSILLTKKELYGFIGLYRNINCILPFNLIRSTRLKLLKECDCQINLTVSIEEVYNNFSIILVKELEPTHPSYSCTNLLTQKLKVGDVVLAKVKSILNYGLFLYNNMGEGLLHISEISTLKIDFPLSEIFEEDEELKVCVIDISNDNKIGFGIKQFKGTEFDGYLKSIELRVFAPELYKIDTTEKEITTGSPTLKQNVYTKGQIFEYFSTIQYDFEGKIKYLELSKVFYSGLKSSRSYFVGIYISYFDILQDIEQSIHNKSEDELNKVIRKSNQLLKQLLKNTETIEKFPTIHKLIFFLEILTQFNSETKGSFEILSKYIFDDEFKEHTSLSMVSKVILSNNLMISGKKEVDFMFKNLRIAFQYLKEGVFEINDTELEKKERELKELISNIRNKIINEESDKVEFKSTLIRPILDRSRYKKYQELLEKDDVKSKSEIENLKGVPAKKRIIHSAMKSLVAFANSKGGSLYIGINDDGEFLGLDNDYDEIGEKSRDLLGKRLDEYINNYIGNSFFGLIKPHFETIEKKEILIIDVDESNKEVFLIRDEKGNECSDFYIRRQSSSVKLEGKELIDYYNRRFHYKNLN